MSSSTSDRSAVLLRDRTSLRLGGPARRFLVVDQERDLVGAVQRADEAGEDLLILGGGSNLVVADEGFAGTVVQVATSGMATDLEPGAPINPPAGATGDGPDAGAASCGGISLTVAAGENWDDLVALAVTRHWVGIEALSGIPGLVGATPIQNVGAYGQQVADTIASVRTWDRFDRCQRTFPVGDCGFGYRTSRFKAEPGRYVVLAVTFQLPRGTLSAPVGYEELARALGVTVGERAPLDKVRAAVLRLREAKGMVLDADDHDTWSAGSFFTNPILTSEQAAKLPADAPRWPQADGAVKTSAAWLIERAGFAKGYGNNRVSLSTKHTLALTNRGGARTSDLLDLAREVRDGVASRFGVVLVNEPILVGADLAPSDPWVANR
ncbi:MAG: UDP-N-acetylmuramate dehydrogenase, partial [Nocardioides sp.]